MARLHLALKLEQQTRSCETYNLASTYARCNSLDVKQMNMTIVVLKIHFNEFKMVLWVMHIQIKNAMYETDQHSGVTRWMWQLGGSTRDCIPFSCTSNAYAMMRSRTPPTRPQYPSIHVSHNPCSLSNSSTAFLAASRPFSLQGTQCAKKHSQTCHSPDVQHDVNLMFNYTYAKTSLSS